MARRRSRSNKGGKNESLLVYGAVGIAALAVMLTKNPVSDTINKLLRPGHGGHSTKKSGAAYSLAPLTDTEMRWGATPSAGSAVGYYYDQ